MTTQLFRNYIGGEWVAGASSSINRNPSDLADTGSENVVDTPENFAAVVHPALFLALFS